MQDAIDLAVEANIEVTAQDLQHDFTPSSSIPGDIASDYFASPKNLLPDSDMWKLVQLNYLNSKEISTQLDNIKIEGDAIQYMIILYSNTVLIIFVGTNGLMSIDPFDLVDETFSLRNELVSPNIYPIHKACHQHHAYFSIMIENK